jgi:hypothetical protein
MINQSIDILLEQITFENIIEKVKRENSQWVVDNIYEYVILITPVPGILIGSNIKLPKYIKDTKSIIGFEGVKNNMCFWHCLSHSMNIEVRNDRLVKKANRLFEEYYKSKPTEVYGGFDIDELENVESHFKVCINIYSINSKHVEIERLSNQNYPKSMNLNLYTEPNTGRHHFSFIKHVKNIIKVFQCTECNVFLSEYKKMKRHYLTCNKGRPKIVFEDGFYQPRKTIFEQMSESGIVVADKDIY